MLGARHGCYKTNCTDWNYVDVRDFDCLEETWQEVKDLNIMDALNDYETLLEREYGLKVVTLTAVASGFFVETIKDQYQQAVEQITWTMKRNAV
jgi:hypothetical protein